MSAFLPFAHHPVVESLPFFVPVLVILALVLVTVVRDRRGERVR